MSLLRTLLLSYDLIETGIRTRNSVHSDNVSYLSQTGLNRQESIIVAGDQVEFNNIQGGIFIRCASPLSATLNNGDAFIIRDLFVNFGSFVNMVLINNLASTDVNYIVVTV